LIFDICDLLFQERKFLYYKIRIISKRVDRIIRIQGEKMSVELTILEMAKAARSASIEMAKCPSTKKNGVLLGLAGKIEKEASYIKEEKMQ
jgi:hypothetical protein